MGIASFALLFDGRPFPALARAGVRRVIETMVAGGPHEPPASLFFTAAIRFGGSIRISRPRPITGTA